MNDYFSDNFYDNFSDDAATNGWSERDWLNYSKKSEAEIAKFAALYSVGRLKGMQLEQIAKMAGWQIIEEEESDYSDENSFDADFSNEPWTLVNHPVYIIYRALMKCLQEHFGRVVEETQMPPTLVFEIEKCLSDTGTNMLLAVGCEDLGEDALARYNYKVVIAGINEVIAKISQIPEPESEHGRERIRRISAIIFDLRQLCLTLLENSQAKKRS